MMLTQAEIDPARYEIFFNKLDAVLQEGMETIRVLSSSTIVREAGESLSAFYLPDTGEAVDIASGILMHFLNVTRVIRYCHEHKYDSPDIGIYDGDQFVNSEAFIGGMHVPDTSMLAPFFYKGEMLGWIAAISHTTEVGGIEPGGMCPSATEAWHDGVHLPAVKLVEKGHIKRDVMNMILRSVRTPRTMDLDLKARMAGNACVRKRLVELVDEFGADFFKAATRRMVQDSEDFCRARIKELRPGIYRTRTFCDAVGKGEDRIAVIELDMEVTEDGRLILAVPVTSPQQPGFNNCYEPAIEATAAYTLLCQLLYDGRWSSGMMRPIELPMSPHSRMKADESMSVGYCTAGIAFSYCAALTDALSRCYFVSGKEDEVQAGAAYSSDAFIASGVDQFSRIFGNVLLHVTFAMGGGGRVNEDGIDNYHFYNPYQYVPDAEGDEAICPALYLNARYSPDAVGYGKHRGCAVPVSIAVIHKTDNCSVLGVASGGYMPGNQGIYGGYPASCTFTDVLLNTNFYEAVKKGEKLPVDAKDVSRVLKGDYYTYPGSMPSIPVKAGDILVMPTVGGGGLGDPIERNPELVVADIRSKKATSEWTKKIYCVSSDPDTLEVDGKKTEELRAQKCKERLRLGKPGKEYLKDLVVKRKTRQLPEPALEFLDELIAFSPEFARQIEDEEALAEMDLEPLGRVEVKKMLLKLTPYVNIVEDGNGKNVAVCSKCGFAYCDANENFLVYCLIYDREGGEVYPERLCGDKEWYVLREFYCPGCGTQIEVEAVPQGNTILKKYELKL